MNIYVKANKLYPVAALETFFRVQERLETKIYRTKSFSKFILNIIEIIP